MREETVTIKGIKDGLLITLSETENWLIVTRDLATRIDEQKSFFAGANITIDLGERPVPKHELSSLLALLERRGLALMLVMSDSVTTIDAANALDLRATGSTDKPNEALPISSEEVGLEGVLIRHTLRSGRTIHSRGHVVVYGDVNPGAEVVASGDVFVWGNLRGNVHAGADGDEDAVICALNMVPTQIRIAGFISTSPKEKRRRKPKPEMALVRDGQIMVEAWQQ